MHADKCPICDGTGRVSHISIDGVGYGEPVTCNGCNGKGWVEVSDSDKPEKESLPGYNYNWYPPDTMGQAHSNPDLLKNVKIS